MSPTIHESLFKDATSSAETISVMLQQEQTAYAAGDYFYRPQQECIVTESDRVKIVDWCYSVVDKCEFDRETVALAMEMVDRFLSIPGPIVQEALSDPRQYQLVAMTALYISIKTNEQVAFGSGYFAEISHGEYTKQDIETMERAMLDGLHWRVCAPTSVQFSHHLLSLVMPQVSLDDRTWGFVLDEVRYQTEHSVRDYYFSIRRKSTVAVAAISNAVDQIDSGDRQSILRALLSIVNEDFASPRELLSARNRLQDSVSGNEALPDEDEDEDDQTSMASEDLSEATNEPGQEHRVSIRAVDMYDDGNCMTVSTSEKSPYGVANCCHREDTWASNVA